MKKIMLALLIFIFIPVCCTAEFDLSGMNYDELVDLSKQVGIAIMQHEQFDSVSVPIGVWEVGVDIPEGTWILTSTNGSFVSITYGPTLEENGNSMNEFDRGNTGQNIDDDQSWKVVARKGNYFEIKYDNVTFTSDTGSIGLGFKKRN